MSKNVKDLMSQLMEFDMDTPIESIQEELGLLPEETDTEEHTVKSVLADLSEVSRPFGHFYVDGEDVYINSEYRDYIHQRALALIDILGTEIAGGANDE